MYSKSYILLFIANLICTGLLIFSEGVHVNAKSVYSDSAYAKSIHTEPVYRQDCIQSVTENVQLERLDSIERVISYKTLQPDFVVEASDDDINSLLKIVEAEAGGEDRKGKLLVANVVINRVKSKRFPNNITDVVYQQARNVAQFSPVSNGRIERVKVSEETMDAVYSALRGEDASNGALFFMARKYVQPENADWFDQNLTFLFSYGGHDFYKR